MYKCIYGVSMVVYIMKHMMYSSSTVFGIFVLAKINVLVCIYTVGDAQKVTFR